jgi:hypothetical protein
MTTTIRRANERGHGKHGWLDTRHTFSFGDYFDPRYMGFRRLRVLNDDRIAPGMGFASHGHRDMEILTWVIDGAVAHRDSVGSEAVVPVGEIQRMSAGTGVVHSEHNASESLPLRLLQIWIEPDRAGHPPSYEQRAFPESERRGRLRLLASPDGSDGSVTLHADARVYGGVLAPGETVRHPLATGRGVWVQLARGQADVGGAALAEGDGAAIEAEPEVVVRGAGETGAEVLVFDLGSEPEERR